MKNVLLLISSLIIAVFLISCEGYLKTDIVGTWERSEDFDYTLIFRYDGTCVDRVEFPAIDPAAWGGTYYLDGTTLIMYLHEGFSDTNLIAIYTIELGADELTLNPWGRHAFATGTYTRAEE